MDAAWNTEYWGGGTRKSFRSYPQPQTPSLPTFLLTFLGIENAGLAQLAEEGAPTAGGLQVVQVEVGWVQPAGQVGEAWKREEKRGCTTSFLPLFLEASFWHSFLWK